MLFRRKLLRSGLTKKEWVSLKGLLATRPLTVQKTLKQLLLCKAASRRELVDALDAVFISWQDILNQHSPLFNVSERQDHSGHSWLRAIEGPCIGARFEVGYADKSFYMRSKDGCLDWLNSLILVGFDDAASLFADSLVTRNRGLFAGYDYEEILINLSKSSRESAICSLKSEAKRLNEIRENWENGMTRRDFRLHGEMVFPRLIYVRGLREVPIGSSDRYEIESVLLKNIVESASSIDRKYHPVRTRVIFTTDSLEWTDDVDPLSLLPYPEEAYYGSDYGLESALLGRQMDSTRPIALRVIGTSDYLENPFLAAKISPLKSSALWCSNGSTVPVSLGDHS